MIPNHTWSSSTGQFDHKHHVTRQNISLSRGQDYILAEVGVFADKSKYIMPPDPTQTKDNILPY